YDSVPLLFHVSDTDHRLVQHSDFGRVPHIGPRHCDGLGQIVRAFPAQHRGHVSILSTRGDYLAHMLAAVLAPVPHKKWMRAVISIPAAVHLDITRVVREPALVLVP